MQTYIRKNHYGQWKAETEVQLDGKQVLLIYTTKNDRGALATNASVHTISDDGLGKVHAVFSDYSKRQMTESLKRITSKAVEEQHYRVLANLPAIKLEVAEFYAAKAQKEKQDAPV